MKDSAILNWGSLSIMSILGIILSFLLIVNPILSGISLVGLTAFSFIFVGVASAILAFNLKKVKIEPIKDEYQYLAKINTRCKYYEPTAETINYGHRHWCNDGLFQQYPKTNA